MCADRAHPQAAMTPALPPELSVVIPVYNEEQVLPRLFERLYPALDALGRSYEIVFVNDGSRDRSVALLREAFERRPEVTRVVLFAANFGQHRAILAGFAASRGRYVITLDADLQNPPEEIPRRAGRTRCRSRLCRHHPRAAQGPSRGVATLRVSSTRFASAPRACALRIRAACSAATRAASSRPSISARNTTPSCRRWPTHLRCSPIEIQVAHEDRGAGVSKYSLFRLMRLNFDLMTGFSTAPMQMVLGLRHRHRHTVGAVRGVPGSAPAHRRARRRKACSRCSRSPSS